MALAGWTEKKIIKGLVGAEEMFSIKIASVKDRGVHDQEASPAAISAAEA